MSAKTMSIETVVVATAELMKTEILQDIKTHTLPASIKSYSELHDYVDANLYGNAEELCCNYEMEVAIDIIDRAQNIVDRWIKGGMQ